MSKSESFSSQETEKIENLGDIAAQRDIEHGCIKRIDAPHEVGDPAAESPSTPQSPADEQTADEPLAEQMRLQADQLAGLLRGRQKELDRREAELNARIAKCESEARAARLWLAERETDLASRGQELVKQQQELLLGQKEVEKRLARLAAAEAAQLTRAAASTTSQAESQRDADALAVRSKELDEAEIRLAETKAETEKLRDQLAQQQRAAAEESAAVREQMAAEHRQAMDDLQRKRQAVQRQADLVDHSRAALTQLRNELGLLHRETLEIRLATEELWTQLSGAAPPAALIQSLGRIRTKLAEQYRQANAELADQKRELEAMRRQLVQQYDALVEQKRRSDGWTACHQEEFQRQASRLAARERQLVEHDEQAVSV